MTDVMHLSRHGVNSRSPDVADHGRDVCGDDRVTSQRHVVRTSLCEFQVGRRC